MPDHRRYPPAPDSLLPHVGTYRRVLPVSLDRLYENALDWEHLPHVHNGSFNSVDCEAAGPWGWRARTTSVKGDSVTLELRLDRECRRWITRTADGSNAKGIAGSKAGGIAGSKAGSEVWTHAFAISPRRTDIVVDFFVPGVAAAARNSVGEAFCKLYERLYDEDVAMMSERQRQLDTRIDPEVAPAPMCIGGLDALSFPMQVDFGGRVYHITRVDDELIAHVARCPHQMGPLEPAAGGVVRCPWHGYRFDAKTGACVTGQACRLPQAPRVVVREDRVWLD
jgi:nitrite reductase/ring-hydroxylating ferredoxin subunit